MHTNIRSQLCVSGWQGHLTCFCLLTKALAALHDCSQDTTPEALGAHLCPFEHGMLFVGDHELILHMETPRVSKLTKEMG